MTTRARSAVLIALGLLLVGGCRPKGGGSGAANHTFNGPAHAIVVDSTRVFVAESTSTGTALSSIERKNGETKRIGTFAGTPMHMVQLGGALIVSTDAGIVRFPLEGLPSPIAPTAHPWRMATDGVALYYFDRPEKLNADASLMRLDVGTLNTTVLARGLYAKTLAVHGDRIYFVTTERPEWRLRSVSTAGGEVATLDQGPISLSDEGAVAILDEHVYYCVDGMNRIPLRSGPREIVSRFCGNDIVTAGKNLYVVGQNPGVSSIYTCNVTKIPSSCSLAIQRPFVFSAAAFGDVVYWAGVEGSPHEHVVKSLAGSAMRER